MFQQALCTNFNAVLYVEKTLFSDIKIGAMIHCIEVDLASQLQLIYGDKYAIPAVVTQEHKDILPKHYPIYHSLYQKVPSNWPLVPVKLLTMAPKICTAPRKLE